MLYYLPRVNILRSVLNITFMSCYGTVVLSLMMSGVNGYWVAVAFCPWPFVRVAFCPVALCPWPFVRVAFCPDPYLLRVGVNGIPASAGTPDTQLLIFACTLISILTCRLRLNYLLRLTACLYYLSY